MKSIIIFGVTGSIGENSLKILREQKSKFKLLGISINKNILLALDIIKEFNVQYIAISDFAKYKEFCEIKPNNLDIVVFYGPDALVELARVYADIFILAIIGIAGIIPSFELLKHGSRLAIANKESIVCGGKLLQDKVKEYKVELIPIDSEHHALFKLLKSNPQKDNIKKIVLTASGGPFYNYSPSDFNNVTVQEALNHPVWKMGKKITIDSASMVNKSLEIMEAFYLFNIPINKIDTIIHPTSVVHSYLEFLDGSIQAEIGVADMGVAISYAINYPNIEIIRNHEFNILNIENFKFYPMDEKKFPSINYAYEVLNEGNIMPIVFNASNEWAVDLFLKEKISFLEIYRIIRYALNIFKNYSENIPSSLDEILAIDILVKDKLTKDYKI